MPHRDPERDKQYKREWYQRNKERISAEKRAQYEESPEPAKARARARSENHGELHRARSRAYREANLETVREKQRTYHGANRDSLNARSRERYHAMSPEEQLERAAQDREYYLENVEKVKIRTKAWAQANPDRQTDYRHRKRARRQGQEPEKAAEYIEVLRGDPCSYCGSTETSTVDHIDPLSVNGRHEWENLTSACKSCNSRKHDNSLLTFLLRR